MKAQYISGNFAEVLQLQKQRIRRAAGLLTAAALLCIAGAVFVPRRYPVADWSPLPGTRYLPLPDGSSIGYQLLRPDTVRSPYPVIFLQGGPGGYIAARTIEILRPFSRAGFPVYAYDQVGSGSSSRLEHIRSYTLGRHIRDLEALIKHTGARRVILLGQSWGGILAAMFAAAHPELVAGAVFTCPGPLPPPDASLAQVPAPDSINLKKPLFSNRQANEEAANWRSRATAWLALNLGVKLMPDAEADAFQSVLNRLLARSAYRDPAGAPAVAQPGGGYYAQLMTVQSLHGAADPRPVLRTLRFPVLILKGQYDNLPWGVTQEYAEVFQNSRLSVIAGAGHSIAMEQPGAYREAILRFLTESFLRTGGRP